MEGLPFDVVVTNEFDDLLLRAARHALIAIVRAIGIRERADDGKLIGHLREAREELADFHAGNIRGNRLELAAHFLRRVRLHVEHAERPDSPDSFK